ncbi:hypothetical protein D3C85_1874040 [compost metagenome]
MRQTAGCKEQDPFIQCAGKSPDGLAEQAGPLETRQRDGHRVDEDRDYRATIEPAK